jgi:hypothetical protein
MSRTKKQQPEPIRIDMSKKGDGSGLGEALVEAMLSGRPVVMFDSTSPETPEFGFGLEIGLAEGGAE